MNQLKTQRKPPKRVVSFLVSLLAHPKRGLVGTHPHPLLVGPSKRKPTTGTRVGWFKKTIFGGRLIHPPISGLRGLTDPVCALASICLKNMVYFPLLVFLKRESITTGHILLFPGVLAKWKLVVWFLLRLRESEPNNWTGGASWESLPCRWTNWLKSPETLVSMFFFFNLVRNGFGPSRVSSHVSQNQNLGK